MSNLTPQDIMGLQEAYNTIYLQEDAEQLDELIAPLIGAGLGYLGAKAGKGFVQGLRGDGNKPVAPTQSRFAGARDAAFNKAQAIKGSPVVGAKPTPTTTAKPGTPPAPAKPAPTAPAAKPAAAKPAPTAPAAKPAPTAPTAPAKPAGSAMDQWAKANPRLAQAQEIRKQGGSRAEVNKALYNKGTAAATSTPTVVKAGFDLFDVIKGHLLDEGYADNEDAALAIMANMSEEWKQNIVEMSPAMQNLLSRPSNRLDGKRSPASGGGQSSTSGAARPAQPQRPQPPGGLTPMQRLQRRPDPTIR